MLAFPLVGLSLARGPSSSPHQAWPCSSPCCFLKHWDPSLLGAEEFSLEYLSQSFQQPISLLHIITMEGSPALFLGGQRGQGCLAAVCCLTQQEQHTYKHF